NKLKVGSTITINGTTFTVVGLVNPTLTGSTSDIYFPLSTLQKMSSKTGRVTQILVKTSSASNVGAVAKEIQKLLPGAQVVTTKAQTVSLHAPVHPTTLLLGIGYAIVGGLLAGAIGGWRAARLAPAEALRNVG